MENNGQTMNTVSTELSVLPEFIWVKLTNYFTVHINLLLSGTLFSLLLATVIVLVIDLNVLGYERSAIRRLLKPSHSARTDWVLYILSTTRIMQLLSIVFSGGLLYFLPKIQTSYFAFDFRIQFDSPVLQFFFFLLLDDFLHYWRHRFGHRISWWWQVHKMHHSATEFNVITVARSHPLDLALGSLFVYLPLSLVGMDFETFILIKVLISIQGKLQHSMVDWDWSWVGKYLLISPIGHRIHHSCEEPHWDKNFGHITPIWDRMFGTWYCGEHVNKTVDVTVNYMNKKGFIYDLLLSQLKFCKFMFMRKWSFRVGVVSDKNKTSSGSD